MKKFIRTDIWSAEYGKFMAIPHKDCGGKFTEISQSHLPADIKEYPFGTFASTSTFYIQRCDKCRIIREVETDAGAKIKYRFLKNKEYSLQSDLNQNRATIISNDEYLARITANVFADRIITWLERKLGK